MPPVPVLKPRRVVKTFEKLGWEIARQRGSHIILTKQRAYSNIISPQPSGGGTWHFEKSHCKGRHNSGGILKSIGKITHNNM